MSTTTDEPSVIAAVKAELAEAPEVEVTLNRFGYEIDGEYHRRVTTLLKGIPKPWLGSWAAKQVAEFALYHADAWKSLPETDALKLLKNAPWSKRDDAGDRGSAIHAAIEAAVKNQPLPGGMSPDEQACAEAALDFIRRRGSRILAAEIKLYSPTYGYAGTTDLWEVDQNGVTWLLDWKTGSGVYPEHAVQLTAYRHAEHAVVKAEEVPGQNGGTQKWRGRRIAWRPEMAERLGVVHVTPEGCQLHPVEESERLWKVFQAARLLNLWQKDTDSYGGKTPKDPCFGDPISYSDSEEAA